MNYYKAKILAATALSTVIPLEYIFKAFKNRYILAYHRVLPSKIAQQFRMQDSVWISVETFHDDIKWMKSHGDIVDLDTILDFNLTNNKPLFSITFDDGWIDNYEYAFPVLKQHNLPATIFLVTNAIETGHLFWVEDFLYKVAQLSDSTPDDIISDKITEFYQKAGATKPNITDSRFLAEGFAELIKPYKISDREALLHDIYHELGIDPEPLTGQILKWADIVKMSKQGIEFGSHTHTHEILQYAENEVIKRELKFSKDIIFENIGKPVKYFCYPNARYRNDNAGLIKEAGYEYAFRIHNLPLDKLQDKCFIPRYIMNEKTSQNKKYLLCKLLNIPKY